MQLAAAGWREYSACRLDVDGGKDMAPEACRRVGGGEGGGSEWISEVSRESVGWDPMWCVTNGHGTETEIEFCGRDCVRSVNDKGFKRESG